MADPLLHAIINGNPLDLPGLGSDDSGMTILFPLSFGNTVNDLANALDLPVDSILAVNPGLQADSPLSVSQVVGLPDDRVGQIMQAVGRLGDRPYVSMRAPASAPAVSSSEPPHTSGWTPVSYGYRSLNDNANVCVPALRALASEPDLSDHPKQAAALIPPVDEQAQDWMARTGRFALSIDGAQPEPSAITPLPKAAPDQMLAAAPSSSDSATTLARVVTPASAQGDVTFATSSQRQNPFEAVINGVQSTSDTTRAMQDRARNAGSDVPPPPMDPRWFAAQITSPVSSGAQVAPLSVVAHAANLSGSPTSLQLMALLVAQSSGSLAAGSASVTPQQSQPFVDPQAMAAFVAATRAVKVVDLGAGRSLEFSLARDRLQRIDPIGQEDRAASGRRTDDGLEEVRISRPDREDVEQTDEQREQGRRRRAAIAAMRRRRRARTRRCRYWRGSRSGLRTSGAARYPKRVDWAEFRSRQPPRYA